MKVVWLQDYDIMTAGGGAQATDRAHFIAGITYGHEMLLHTPQAPHLSSDFDLVIASNPVFLPPDFFRELQQKQKPYIYFFHDYEPVCKYRLFYPMRESCRSCYLMARWLPVLLAARSLIWLSPLHRESWLWLCPELEGMKYHLSPSPVDTRAFFDMGLPRQGAVAVESLAAFKGRKHVLRWAQEHPQEQVTFVGGDPGDGDIPPNGTLIPGVPPWAMNEVYNRHKALLHLPQSPSPFDRVTVEAYLAGCSIIGNRLIGALSYPWFTSREEVASHIKSSSREFWEAVEHAM